MRLRALSRLVLTRQSAVITTKSVSIVIAQFLQLIHLVRPLYRTQGGQWRALSNGSPVVPSVAFSYITRSFRQTTPYIMGALKLLAESYTSEELNQKAWSLYADFRPEVNEWGKRSEVKCSVILGLRKQKRIEDDLQPVNVDKPVVNQESVPENASSSDEQKAKRPRFLTVEEYEAALDLDTTFDDVNLDAHSVKLFEFPSRASISAGSHDMNL